MKIPLFLYDVEQNDERDYFIDRIIKINPIN